MNKETKKATTNTTTKKATETKKEKKVLTQEELNNILSALDKNVFVRRTTNNDLACEIFDTALPSTRCGLWQRGTTGKRYDLYIGNATKYSEKAKTLNSVDYTTDKKMSKKEVAFLKCSLDDVKNIISQLTATETKKVTNKKATTKKVTNKKEKSA